MIEYYFKTAKDENFISIASAKEGCWIHLEEVTTPDLEFICELTGIEYNDLQDSLDKYEIPRIEKVLHHTLIYSRHPIELDVAVGLYTATLTMIITSHYFITISPQKNTLIRTILSRKSKLSTLQRSKLAIHIFMKI